MESKALDVTAKERRNALVALGLLIFAPSVGIACEMIWFPGPMGLSILGVTKLWILLFPLVWTVKVDREKLGPPARTSRGLSLGLVSGIIGATAVVVLYQTVLAERIDPALLREMARKNHLLTPATFIAVTIYTCVLNSLLEEYVWRWFVYGKFARLLPRRLAVLASAAAFTLHHTLILASQFNAELAVIGSIAVFVAGATWSWIYARTQSIWPAWLSHAMIDVAVFWAGWQILFVD